MSTKKTISINPDLFNITKGRTKTKKNVSKPLVIPPLISSNILKHKFLERIKKHKLKETEGLENNKKKLGESNNNSLEKSKNTYTDEFNDSISYLQSLSNQKKIDKKKELLNNRTIKKHDTYIGGMTPSVNLDLPEELIETITPSSYVSSSMSLKYNDVPYGVLKGGSKPTYREYNKTQRNFEVINPRQALVIDNVQTINSINNSDREKRMTNLKEKLLQKKMEKEKQTKIDYSTPSNTSIINIQTEIPSNNNNNNNNNNNSVINNSIIEDEEIFNPTVAFGSDIKETHQPQNETHQPQNEINNVPIKKILKKTIKKNYILGKSTINKTVGVLLKDRATRKKVLNAHKEIKKHNINDVKEYLRNHNLIKIGGNAPNDVIRKMYEASMLTGEVTNINKEAMIHNFIKDDNK